MVKTGNRGVMSLVQKKKNDVKRLYFLFLSGTNVFNGIFFERHFFCRVIWNLKGCVSVYVPHVSGHKISVKGALGVGGGGEEWLKTYTCVRTGDGVVL